MDRELERVARELGNDEVRVETEVAEGYPAETIVSRAAERRTSISAEAVRLIERGLRTDRLRIEELLARIEAKRPAARPGAPSAADLIRRDRDER